MSEKQRGEVNMSFPKGYFREFSGFEPIQFYQIYEREIHAVKPLELPVLPQGYVFVYCVAGAAKLKNKTRSFVLQEGTILLCSADEVYTLEPTDRHKGFRYVCLHLQISEKHYPISTMSELCAFYVNADMPLCAQSIPQVEMIVSSLISELCVVKKTVPLLIRDLLYQLMVLSYRSFTISDTETSERDMTIHVVGHTAYAVIRYVDEHLYSMNNLADMAKELGYSYNYLSHLFRRKTGMTIQAYVSQKKIQKSVELLSDETLSITEIATMLNYDCIQSFSKAFKRMMKMSPTEYRIKKGIFTD